MHYLIGLKDLFIYFILELGIIPFFFAEMGIIPFKFFV